MKQGCSCTNTASRVKQGQTDGWSLEESDVWFIEALFLSNHVPAAFSNPHICSNASPKLGPRTAKLHSSFSVFYFLCYFPSSPNTHPSPPPPFALWLPWQQQHCTIHLLETWAPVPVERACLSHLYITCWVLMQSRRRGERGAHSSRCSQVPHTSVSFLFFIFYFYLSEKVSPGCTLPSQGVTSVSLHFSQWHSDCCVLPSSFLFFCLPPSLPPSPLPFSCSSRHCHICLALYHLLRLYWAGSISTETCGDFIRKERGAEREGKRVNSSSLIPLLLYLFPVLDSFSPPPLFFYLMNWLLLKEEGLLVSLEGEGGELVPYSSLQECKLWFENGEPCHTLSHLSHSCNYACECCLLTFTCCSTFAPQLCVLSDLTAGAALSVILLNGICKK